MWLLPIEKLPPLILGPVAMAVGVWVLLQPEIYAGHDPIRRAIVVASGLVGGACLTAYGVWRLVTQRGASSSAELESTKEARDNSEERYSSR